MGKLNTNNRLSWLEEDMGMCDKHPDEYVFFSLKGDYAPLCVVCVQNLYAKDSKGDNNE